MSDGSASMRDGRDREDVRPLTERVLAWLPGSRVIWILAWALVPWVNAGVNLLLEEESRSAVWDQSGVVIVLNYAALSGAIVLCIWGSKRVVAQLARSCGLRPFRELRTWVPPLGASLVVGSAFGLAALVEDGSIPGIVRGTTWVVVGAPLWSFLWTYISLQIGLYRLGGEPIAAEARMDPGLGLRPLGDVAYSALWILLAWLVPLVLTGLPDAVGVALGVGVLVAALATFFLSLVRLHQRMVDVKAEELDLARDLYTQAYAPVRDDPSLETLERQRNLLSAADMLEKRAKAIHDWPIDEGTFARVLTIATSVVAVTIARLLLDPFGL